VPKPDFDERPDAPVPLDFAYCVTCHKSQGSEFDTGLVVEQFCPKWEHARWAYTAATRFRERVYWTNPKWE
jgi:exodeoxyribonuclease-5